MLKKIKNQENILIMFFVLVLMVVGTYIILERNIVDIFYFGVMLCFFFKFLIIKRNGK